MTGIGPDSTAMTHCRPPSPAGFAALLRDEMPDWDQDALAAAARCWTTVTDSPALEQFLTETADHLERTPKS